MVSFRCVFSMSALSSYNFNELCFFLIRVRELNTLEYFVKAHIYVISINLLASYHQRRSLIGYATHYPLCSG